AEKSTSVLHPGWRQSEQFTPSVAGLPAGVIFLALRGAAPAPERLQVRRNPSPNHGETKFAAFHRAPDELIRRLTFHFQEKAIQAKKNVGQSECEPFVPIHESMVVCERLHEGGGFFRKFAVVADLRTKERSLQTGLVQKSVGTAEQLDQLPVDFNGFCEGGIQPAGHLLGQEAKQLFILCGRFAKMSQHLGTNRSLRRHDRLEIELQGLLQEEAPALAVLLRKLAQMGIEFRIDLESELRCCPFCHAASPSLILRRYSARINRLPHNSAQI